MTDMLRYPSMISGTYTVDGSSTCYTNLSAALSALAGAVSGPVIFKLRPGKDLWARYYEKLILIVKQNQDDLKIRIQKLLNIEGFSYCLAIFINSNRANGESEKYATCLTHGSNIYFTQLSIGYYEKGFKKSDNNCNRKNTSESTLRYY